MGFAELLILAIGLSMDAFAVCISNAMCYRGITSKQRLAAAVSFGVFQGVMPIIGFFAGRLFGEFIMGIDHIVALVLLGIIGGKMLIEGIRSLREPESCEMDACFTVRVLLTQAVATSIDALAVGISFAALNVNVWYASGVIAACTCVICIAGGWLGKRFGMLLGNWAQVAGGLVLVGIGVKIFVEHMFFS